MNTRNIILTSTETEAPWVRLVTNETDGTSFGRVGAIHLSYGYQYLGLAVPGKWLSLREVRDITVKREGDCDHLDIILGEDE